MYVGPIGPIWPVGPMGPCFRCVCLILLSFPVPLFVHAGSFECLCCVFVFAFASVSSVRFSPSRLALGVLLFLLCIACLSAEVVRDASLSFAKHQ